ncbi:MAG: hypothetical protein HQM14_09180 [SAR324 cluster bacterium]|nr:hypothetical protein [SAR324 cluster bacterium]
MKKYQYHFLCVLLILFMFSNVSFAQKAKPEAKDKAGTKTNPQEEIPSCRDLIPPETPEDVKMLRQCIHKRKRLIAKKHKKEIIQRMVERDKQLRESKLASYCIYDPPKNYCNQIPKPQPAK